MKVEVEVGFGRELPSRGNGWCEPTLSPLPTSISLGDKIRHSPSLLEENIYGKRLLEYRVNSQSDVCTFEREACCIQFSTLFKAGEGHMSSLFEPTFQLGVLTMLQLRSHEIQI